MNKIMLGEEIYVEKIRICTKPAEALQFGPVLGGRLSKGNKNRFNVDNNEKEG